MTLTQIKSFFTMLSHKMRSYGNTILVPFDVRGMKVLEHEKFLRNLRIPVLKVSQENLSKVSQHCKVYFLKLENFKPVQNDDCDSSKKCVYMNPELITEWEDLSEEILALSDKNVVISKNDFITKEVQFTYNNWSMDTIFKAVLPENEEIVSGFSQIGHIIHLNLREHLLDYRPLIGQVLVDKIKTCRTVVNKSNTIDNTFRNFKMEVIAGEEDFLVTVKENRCNFQFDFSKVYWNPRLGKEHERILEYLKPGNVLFDIFCGVGPFAIPAAKKKCKVYANDLNPDSFQWLNHNAKHNKVNTNLFKSYNMDGKDFICTIFKDYINDYCNGKQKLEKGTKIHITMNLPALAVEFIKYYKGLLTCNEGFDLEIVVYVYCFAVGEDPIAVAKTMVNENMGCDMSDYIIDVFNVRKVSPMKDMIRVTFKLTKDILFNSDSEPPKKKLCVEQ